MESLTTYIKDEATGELHPWFAELDFQDDYLAYEGGEVWFSFTNILLGQVEDSEYFAYQWTCSYTNVEEGNKFSPQYGQWVHLSRAYNTLDEARTACWATLTDKARYDAVLNFITNGEQTLEQLGLFLDE